MTIDRSRGRELIRQIEPHIKGGRELIQQIESHAKDLVDAVAAARFWQQVGLERAEVESSESEANAQAKRDRELREATERCTQAKAQAGEEYKQKISASKARYDQSLGEVRAKRNNEVNAAAEQHRKMLADEEARSQNRVTEAEASYKWKLDQAESSYQPQIDDLKVRSKQAWEEAEERYKEDWARIQDELQALTADGRYSTLPFGDSAWANFEPSFDTLAPRATRLGTQTYSAEWGDLVVPALTPIIGGRNLVIKVQDGGRAAGIQIAQAVMLRLLASLPPGKLRFTLIDPMGRGQHVAAFMHLVDPKQDQDQDLVIGKRAWANPQHIEARLADLNEHVENVIQRDLRNKFATIDEYNEQAGQLARPYHIVVALNFPAGFSETAAQQLLSLAESGPRCGVYVLMSLDTKQRAPHGFDPAAFDPLSTVVTWDEQSSCFKCPGLDEKSRELHLDELPDPEEFNKIIEAVAKAAKSASKVEVPFEDIALAQDKWWTDESWDGLQAPLGPAGATERQDLVLGSKGTAVHALVVGRTGSGKSTLLHTLITSLALAYSPEEVELYLIDFKEGVEFKLYAEHELPHARVIAIAGEREFGLSVLKRLDEELKDRGDKFRAMGVNNLADYRQKPGSEPLPRILLLVDEFQEFFVEDDAIATQTAQILDRMVRQGRYSGIHVLLSSQTLAGSYSLPRSTVDQIGVRIALQCSEADSRLILAEDNPAARLLTRPGEAIYNAANGMFEGNNTFQVALLTEEVQRGYLKEVREKYLERLRDRGTEEEWHARTIVFEGQAPARVEDNQALESALGAPTLASGDPGSRRHLSAWLGDSMTIRKEPVAATFRRQSGSNLLIVGQSDEAVPGIVATAIIGLAAQVSSSSPEDAPADELRSIYLLDFGAGDSSRVGELRQLAEGLPGSVEYGRRRELTEVLSKLSTELQHRLEAEDGDETPAIPARPLFLFVYGLHRARDLRPDDALGSFPPLGSFSMDEEPAAPNPAEQFATLLRDGPEVGIHTVVWCDRVTNLNRSLDRRSLREFAMRVALQMSAEDSSMLLESPMASKLTSHRALFYDEEEGLLEKFRPYGRPSPEWLAWVAGMMVRA